MPCHALSSFLYDRSDPGDCTISASLAAKFKERILAAELSDDVVAILLCETALVEDQNPPIK
jgi:hypothetical protein